MMDNYACDQCTRTYRSRDALRRHRNTHSFEKRHPCDTCSCVFYRRDLLLRHRQIHKSPGNRSRNAHRARAALACASCRESKTKCGEERPCLRCRENGRECTPSRGPLRMSLREAVNTANNPETNSDNLAQECSETLSECEGHMLPSNASPEAEPGITQPNPLENVNKEATHNFISPGGGFETLDFLDLPDFDQWLSDLNPTIAGSTLSWSDDAARGTSHDIFSKDPLPIPESILPVVSRANDESLQGTIVESLIKFADRAAQKAGQPDQRTRILARRQAARNIETAFDFHDPHSKNSRHVLDHCVSLFLDRFHAADPIFWMEGFDSYSIASILFLSMVSIGSRYAGENGTRYGQMLHAQLRSYYFRTAAEKTSSDQAIIFLVFGYLLLSAELFFGDDASYRYAQHINSILVSQCRQLKLFDDQYLTELSTSLYNTKPRCSDERLMRWVDGHMRSRIAYGVFRADGYLSMILNTLPLIRYSEVSLEMPRSVDNFTYTGYDWQRRALEEDEEAQREPKPLFAELMETSLCRELRLPPLDVYACERILLGLNESIWRSSESRKNSTFSSLDPQQLNVVAPPPLSRLDKGQGQSRPGSAVDDPSHMVQDQQLFEILRSLMIPQPIESVNGNSEHDTPEVLVIWRAGLLFQLAELRLNSPLECLRIVADDDSGRACVKPTRNNKFRSQAFTWVRSADALIALEHAHSIWKILFETPQRLRQTPCETLSLVALIALSEAALVVWAMEEVYLDSDDSSGVQDAVLTTTSREERPSSMSNHSLPHKQSTPLIKDFVTLLGDLAPSWSGRERFAKRLKNLAVAPFSAKTSNVETAGDPSAI